MNVGSTYCKKSLDMGSTFCKKSLAMGTLFLRITPEDGYGVQGSGLTPPVTTKPEYPPAPQGLLRFIQLPIFTILNLIDAQVWIKIRIATSRARDFILIAYFVEQICFLP